MNSFHEFRFLIVDDSAEVRRLLRLQLERQGFGVILEAADGKSAWALLEEEALARRPVHGVISDWEMPEISGIELLKRCRSHVAYNNIAFLMVTSLTEPPALEEARLAGVDDYVIKPFDPIALRKRIRDAIYAHAK